MVRLYLHLLIFSLVFFSEHCVATRVKDIAFVEGVRDNFIQGYGLVTGLSGTGDNLSLRAYKC